MTIEESNVVDFIGIDKETGAVGLLISDHLEWLPSKNPLIKDKVNAYLDYIESGELLKAYPDAADRDVYIELVHQYPPTEAALKILTRIRQVAKEVNTGFSWSKLVDD